MKQSAINSYKLAYSQWGYVDQSTGLPLLPADAIVVNKLIRRHPVSDSLTIIYFNDDNVDIDTVDCWGRLESSYTQPYPDLTSG